MSVPGLLTENCKAQAKKGTKSIGGSKVVQCGIPPVVSVLAPSLWMKDMPMKPTEMVPQKLSAPAELSMMESSFSQMIMDKLKDGVQDMCR